jgi:hypothetical protein
VGFTGEVLHRQHLRHPETQPTCLGDGRDSRPGYPPAAHRRYRWPVRSQRSVCQPLILCGLSATTQRSLCLQSGK